MGDNDAADVHDDTIDDNQVLVGDLNTKEEDESAQPSTPAANYISDDEIIMTTTTRMMRPLGRHA